MVNWATQCPGLRKDINVGFQIVRGQPTSSPSNASAPAGEQVLQSLIEAKRQEFKLKLSLKRDLGPTA